MRRSRCCGLWLAHKISHWFACSTTFSSGSCRKLSTVVNRVAIGLGMSRVLHAWIWRHLKRLHESNFISEACKRFIWIVYTLQRLTLLAWNNDWQWVGVFQGEKVGRRHASTCCSSWKQTKCPTRLVTLQPLQPVHLKRVHDSMKRVHAWSVTRFKRYTIETTRMGSSFNRMATLVSTRSK